MCSSVIFASVRPQRTQGVRVLFGSFTPGTLGPMPRKRKSLVTEGEPLQRTAKGLEIPVPTRGEFFANLEKVAKADERPAKSKRKR
jgi:hypothetical protein